MRQQVRRRNQQKRRLANSPPQPANLPPKKNNRRPPPRPNKRIASQEPQKPQKSRLEPYKKKIVPQEKRQKLYLQKQGGKEAGGKRYRGKEVNRSHNKRPLPPSRSKLPLRGKEVPKRVVGGKLPPREANPYLRQNEAKRQREPPIGQRAKAPSREVKPQPPRREPKEPPKEAKSPFRTDPNLRKEANLRGKSEENIDEFTAPQAPRPRKRKPILAVRRRKPSSKPRKRVNVQKESKISSESDSLQQQLRKNPPRRIPRPTTTISTTSTSTKTSSASRIPVVNSQNSVVRQNSHENVGGFTKEGPDFAFPDMDMDGKKFQFLARPKMYGFVNVCPYCPFRSILSI